MLRSFTGNPPLLKAAAQVGRSEPPAVIFGSSGLVPMVAGRCEQFAFVAGVAQ
jgi:hypothetical protein